MYHLVVESNFLFLYPQIADPLCGLSDFLSKFTVDHLLRITTLFSAPHPFLTGKWRRPVRYAALCAHFKTRAKPSVIIFSYPQNNYSIIPLSLSALSLSWTTTCSLSQVRTSVIVLGLSGKIPRFFSPIPGIFGAKSI